MDDERLPKKILFGEMRKKMEVEGFDVRGPQALGLRDNWYQLSRIGRSGLGDGGWINWLPVEGVTCVLQTGENFHTYAGVEEPLDNRHADTDSSVGIRHCQLPRVTNNCWWFIKFKCIRDAGPRGAGTQHSHYT